MKKGYIPLICLAAVVEFHSLILKGLFVRRAYSGDLINTIVGRGGYVKDLHGQKNMYYQVNATYYSALGESDDRMPLQGLCSFSCLENPDLVSRPFCWKERL
ncbi:MAG: hypothetical protein V8S42_04300 [Lachnospiraceae bacterium]